MEHRRRHTGTNSQGNTARTQEKETQTTSSYNNQQHKSGQKKCKNCRYKKPNIPITNLSNHQLSRDEITLLSKGLNFIPTPRRDHPAKMLQDILLFDRKIKLKYHFSNDSDQNQGSSQQTNNQILHPSSGWTPSAQDPFLDTYRKFYNKCTLKRTRKPHNSKKKNLSHKELQAMRDLHKNTRYHH